MQVKPKTLAVAIQCVSAAIKVLDNRMENATSTNAAELEQLLVTFDLAGIDLKAAYESAWDQYDALPAYEELLKWSL